MPSKINWETTEISFYKFVCKNPDILFSYVGHTVSFRQRKSAHKSSCNNPNSKEHNYPLYVFIRQNGGFQNWDMIVINTQICKDKRDAERIEHELIEKQQFKLNANRAYSGINLPRDHTKYGAEYYIANRDIIAIQQSEYYGINRDNIAIKKSEYYGIKRNEIAIKKSEYYKTNKDVILAKSKAKYALQKSQILCEILDATNP